MSLLVAARFDLEELPGPGHITLPVAIGNFSLSTDELCLAFAGLPGSRIYVGPET